MTAKKITRFWQTFHSQFRESVNYEIRPPSWHPPLAPSALQKYNMHWVFEALCICLWLDPSLCEGSSETYPCLCLVKSSLSHFSMEDKTEMFLSGASVLIFDGSHYSHNHISALRTVSKTLNAVCKTTAWQTANHSDALMPVFRLTQRQLAMSNVNLMKILRDTSPSILSS